MRLLDISYLISYNIQTQDKKNGIIDRLVSCYLRKADYALSR